MADVVDDSIQPGIHNETTKYLSPDDVRLIMNAKTTDDISIIYLNIGSVPLHIDELQNFLVTTNCYPSIIALAETKITQTVNTEFHPHLENYTYLNVASSTHFGSVGVFIKKDINYAVRQDLNMWQSKMWETLWLEIDFNKTKNFIGVVYRHTGMTDIPFFSRTLEKNLKKITNVKNKNSKFYIVGDFNLDAAKIDQFPNISDFVDMMYSYNAIMLVNKPTRFPIGNQRGDPSIIDHFYTNDPLSIKTFGIVINGISPDHLSLFAIIENKF